MPINGITAGLMEVGKIKIGKKGKMITSAKGNEFRPPEKLDHFMIVKNERDQNGDFVPDATLMEKLMVSPSKQVVTNGQNKLIGIPIRLLYNDIDLNFPTRFARYSRGKRACEGDGVDGHTRDGRTIKCTCAEFETGNCKVNGTLSCIIDGTELLGGCYKFRTTSINTVSSIIGSLRLIQTITKGHLAFLPLTLMLQPKITTTPAGDITKVYVVSIVFNGNVDALRQAALSNVEDNARYLIDMKRVEDDARGVVDVISAEDDIEIMEEFYPDAAKHIEHKPQEQKPEEITKSEEPAKSEDPIEYGQADQEKEPPTTTDEQKLFLTAPADPVKQRNAVFSMLKVLRKNELIETIRITHSGLSLAGAKTKTDFLKIFTENYDQLDKPVKTVQQAIETAKKLIEIRKKTGAPETEKPLLEKYEERKMEEDAAAAENSSIKEPGSDGNGESSKETVVVANQHASEKDESGPVTTDQLRQILGLKQRLKITDPAEWADKIKPFNVPTARELTQNQADQLISELSDPPFG